MKKKILYIAITVTLATAVVVGLFFTSEHIMKKENPFVRRFIPHPITDVQGLELPYNSYYLAGFNDNKIYLGNYTAPLHGLILTTKPEIVDSLNLFVKDDTKKQFAALKWYLVCDTIIMNDYTQGTFYAKNQESNEITEIHKNDTVKFSLAIPINIENHILRTFTNEKKEHFSLAVYNYSKNILSNNTNSLYEKDQSQDLFSNDGMLLFNKHLRKIIYVFYYKNKVLVYDSMLNKKEVLQTIDTITEPNFKITHLEKKQQLKMSTNAIKVNKMATTAGKYLFIASDRIGKNESSSNYNNAAIIDVYDIEEKSYVYSFYFYHFKNTPITQIQVYDNYIIGIGKNQLSIAKFKRSIYD